MKLKFQVKFLKQNAVVGSVEGAERALDNFRVDDLGQRIIETEQFLERLTGLRVHIEQVG